MKRTWKLETFQFLLGPRSSHSRFFWGEVGVALVPWGCKCLKQTIYLPGHDITEKAGTWDETCFSI